jgi:hypothetical protein
MHNPVLGMKKYYPTKVIKGLINDLTNNIINISNLYRESIFNFSILKKLDVEIIKYTKKIDKADYVTAKYLQEKLIQSNFRFSEQYTDRYLIDCENNVTSSCYICASEVSVKQQVNIVKKNVTRSEHICMICGGIEDKPDDDIVVEIYYKKDKEDVKRMNVNLMIINNSRSALKGYGGVAIQNRC